jgi:molybdate transport system substrate-binding protein
LEHILTAPRIIEEIPRADVFVSADMAQIELAKKNGMVQGEMPVFVKNRLVVIVPRRNPGQVTAFWDLAKLGLKLTLGAPKVPIGNYSRQAFSKANTAYGADFAERHTHEPRATAI